MSKKKAHLHTLKRDRKNPELYLCADPDCYYRIQKRYLQGKRVRCICGAEFILTSYDLKLAIPKCPSCSTARHNKEFLVQQEKMKALLDEPINDNVPDFLKEIFNAS